jgi:radical SAM protein with 4Fe4S-binding SPASM domain
VPSAEVIARFPELRDRGVSEIIFSGGEPLLRRDLLAIVAAAQDFGFAVDLCTNATLVTQTVARELATRLGEISVSLDGNRETHDRRRGPGSFTRARRGVELLRDAGLGVHLIAVLEVGSMAFVEAALQEAETLGVHSLTFLGLMATALAQRQCTTDGAFTAAFQSRRERSRLQVNTKRVFFSADGFECPAGDSVLGIDSSGELLPCILFSNGGERQLAGAWRAELSHERALRCRGCERIEHCGGGCPGSAWLAAGRLGPDALCTRQEPGGVARG